ncbi:MAG: PVC-type heme-binding CxxCH protein [Pirellulales bacterium]
MYRPRLLFGCLLGGVWALAGGCLPGANAAEPFDYHQSESPPLPAPSWVRMIDQGTLNPRLAGIHTPDGIKIEIVAQEPQVINPVGMAFDDSGRPYVLEWRVAPDSRHEAAQVTLQDGSTVTVNRMRKSVPDVLKTLADTDGDGIHDRADERLNDLELPSSLLLHDGWLYTSALGQVVRRQHSPPDGDFGPPQEIVRGLCGFHHHQASGLTLSHDGWLYITSGDDDNHGEGSDGSQATVLRTGAVFRCRPDGSALHEHARGFRNPYRDVAFDQHYNMFHVDNDQEDGSKFQGVRLMHVPEGADFGWRLFPGAVCCRADIARGAAFGESPGKMPAMLKTGRGAPAGLLIYQGTSFPEFFRGLLIYPDVYRKSVRAYAIERVGGTFEVTRQFTLMSSADGLFRPCQAVQGPDGAIYIVDWRTDSGGAGQLWGDGVHGRIYKLTWGGTAEVPAMPPGPLNAWTALRRAGDETLWSLLDTADFQLRQRVQQELIRRGGSKQRARFLTVAASQGRSSPARVSAMGAACQMFNRDVYDALIRLLNDGSFEIRRAAAELLGRNAPDNSHEAIAGLGQAMQDPHPAVARSAGLAYGELVALLAADDQRKFRLAEQLRNAMAACDRDDVYLFDGFVRGLEKLGRLGVDKLLLWAWSNDDTKCETAIAAVERMRTVEAADGLDRLLQGDTSFDDDQTIRLMRTYRNILVEPPISAGRVAEWLAEHPDAAVEVKIAGMETLALVGGGNSAVVQDLALSLLHHEQPEARASALAAIASNGLVAAAPALLAALKEPGRTAEEQQQIIAALGRLRSRPAPFTAAMSPPGVEPLLNDLLKLAQGEGPAEVRGDILALVAQVDYTQAEPLALDWLKSDDEQQSAAAIDILGTRPEQALELGRAFVAGRIARPLLPKVAAALQKHAEKEKDAAGPFHALLTEVFKGGLLVSLDPAEIERVDGLVRSSGNALRGRAVYLDSQRSQCANCHTLEGVGGQIGPDLSKVWQTHSTAKIMESMIDPSKEIKEGFATWSVTTNAGRVHAGLKIVDDPREVVLRDASGKDIRISTGEIDDKAAGKKSLMPDGVIAQLSFREFVDLVAFLKDKQAQESLRGLLTQAWAVGPFAPGAESEAAAAAIEKNPDPTVPAVGDTAWQRIPADADGLVNLRRRWPAENTTAYVLSYLHSPQDQQAQVRVTGGDGLKLWINGQNVLDGSQAPADEAIPLPLNAGWNTVLVRVTHGRGPFGLGLAVVQGDGVRFALEKKEAGP